jgi:hypothetical protein
MSSGICSRIRAVPISALLLFVVFSGSVLSRDGARSASGAVTDNRGNFLPGAVVQIENSVTLEIRSFIVQKDGRYRFSDLNPDVEFVLHAQYHGHISKYTTLSKFDGTKNARINFVIPIE